MDDISLTKTGNDVVADDDITKSPSASTISKGDDNVDFVGRALRFLASATPETLGAVVVALSASTYLILGRLGLVILGVVGGIVLHASWEGHVAASPDEARREKGLEILKRLLDSRNARSSGNCREVEEHTAEDSFEGFQPETSKALAGLVEAVVRDYVKWWYQPILPQETSFPVASRRTLIRFLLSISQHLSKKRPADSFLDFLTNSSSILIVFLSELAVALSQNPASSPSEAIHLYLDENPESSLGNVLSEEQQSKKFKIIAEDILQNFLDKNTYDCEPARSFLREILAGVVLETTLKSCSKPEWINGWIVYLLEEGEPDLSQAIDAGMGAKEAVLSTFNDFDGNVGNISLAKPKMTKQEREMKQVAQGHRKRLSKAEEAMEEAMEEARRLSQLIAEEDEKRRKEIEASTSKSPADFLTDNTHSSQSTPAPTMSGGISHIPHVRKDDSDSKITTESSIGPNELPSLSDRNFTNEESKTLSELLQTSEPSTPSLLAIKSHDQIAQLPLQEARPAFTSFDQIIPPNVPAPITHDTSQRKAAPLTLLNAAITIYDDTAPNDTGKLRNKPTADYLVQIEPISSQHPGWMIVRKYPDFETLHEVLRRIAQISGVAAFTEQHHSLPSWRNHTKASLRGELERYLREALWYQPLAESEGMKRFLEKDQGQSSSNSKSSGVLGWPTPSAFEAMGKGMLDVLTSAPKGVAESGKALGGGITGVLNNIGNLGQKKQTSAIKTSQNTAGQAAVASLPRMDSTTSLTGSRRGRASEDGFRPASIIQTQPSMIAPMERRPSFQSIVEGDDDGSRRGSVSARSSMSGRRSVNQSREPSRAPSMRGTPISSPTHNLANEFKLPPLPTDIPDDYGSAIAGIGSDSRTDSSGITAWTPTSTVPSQQSPGRPSMSSSRENILPSQGPVRKARRETAPLSEVETRVAVELLFAVVNELYTLSSAWNIRRSLLAAAKTFLLRPGNPSLSSIQALIQDSVIASNTSDAGIASHLRKLRENSLPTEEELKSWPAEMSMEEKERLRVKARRLLVERGLPAALTGVMGNAATAEAMGKVFDCLQVDEVARGLIFGLLLQGVRAVTH